MFKYAFVIFVIFLVLQLCGVIDWSWWWIFSPLWIFGGRELYRGVHTRVDKGDNEDKTWKKIETWTRP